RYSCLLPIGLPPLEPPPLEPPPAASDREGEAAPAEDSLGAFLLGPLRDSAPGRALAAAAATPRLCSKAWGHHCPDCRRVVFAVGGATLHWYGRAGAGHRGGCGDRHRLGCRGCCPGRGR